MKYSILLLLALTGSVWAQDAKKEAPPDPCALEAKKGDKADKAVLAKCAADAEAAKKAAAAPKPAPK